MSFSVEDISFPYGAKAFNRHCRHYYNRHHEDVSMVSRKTKKFIIGKKWGKASLKRRISAVKVTINKYPQSADLSDRFCPKCGCNAERSTGNMASYPELWERRYCQRCGYLVGESDNSPFVHVLELMRGPEKQEWDPRYWG